MGKQKYAVEYTEVYRKIFLVEADSPEEAEEKMEYVAENIPIDMDNCFDHWDIAVMILIVDSPVKIQILLELYMMESYLLQMNVLWKLGMERFRNCTGMV